MKYKVKISAQKSKTNKAINQDFAIESSAVEFLHRNVREAVLDVELTMLHADDEHFLVFNV